MGLALTARARGARYSRHDFPHFGVKLLAHALVLGELALVLRMVGSVLRGHFLQLCFSVQEIPLQSLNERVVANVRHPVRRPPSPSQFPRLLLPPIPLQR